MRVDGQGNFWDLIGDLWSLGNSVLDVIENPTDPWAWASLGGDALDLAVPFFSGGGETVRVVKAVNNVVDAVDDVADVKKGWKIGEDITNLTKAGTDPSWSAVKARYWKNEAYFNSAEYSVENIRRMKQGKPPQVMFDNGKLYSMELHHKKARRDGGDNSYGNLQKVTPWEHAEIDPYRYFKP